MSRRTDCQGIEGKIIIGGSIAGLSAGIALCCKGF